MAQIDDPGFGAAWHDRKCRMPRWGKDPTVNPIIPTMHFPAYSQSNEKPIDVAKRPAGGSWSGVNAAVNCKSCNWNPALNWSGHAGAPRRG